MTNRYHILETMKLGRLVWCFKKAWHRHYLAMAWYALHGDEADFLVAGRYLRIAIEIEDTLTRRLEEVDEQNT